MSKDERILIFLGLLGLLALIMSRPRGAPPVYVAFNVPEYTGYNAPPRLSSQFVGPVRQDIGGAGK